MKPVLILFFFFTVSFGVLAQDTVSVQQSELIALYNSIKGHPPKDTIRVQLLMDYANLCFYHLDFLNGFKAANEARSIAKEINFKKGEGLYLKSISIFRRRINAGNAYIKTQDINKMNEVNEFINGLDIYYEVKGNGVLGRYTDFDIFGNINMPIGIKDSEIETIGSKLEEALSYYAEKENAEITAYLQDALSFIYFKSDKEKSKKHKNLAQSLYQELKWSYHQLFILAHDIHDLLGQGMEAEAKPLEIEAITIYTHEADKYIKAQCAYLLSRAYGIHNRVNLQLEYLFQAEELLNEIGEKDLLKPVYISVAIVYEWYLTNSEKALEYEYKELNLRKEINHYERIANTYLLISESLFGLKRIQDFPPEYKDYLRVGGVKGSLFFDAELLWVKARMLQAQGKSEEAQSVFQESITAYLKYNDKHGASWAAFDLAESYKSVGELNNAFNYAHKSFDWASDVNLLPKLIHSAGLLSQLYEQTGNKSKAFFYLKKFKEVKEKEERLNNAANRSELEIQGVLKKRQRDIELLESKSQLKEQENKTQRIWLFSITGALVSLVFLSFILVRNNRQKQKANRVLNSKNRELEIEAALERVRSASMAMHKSEDLVNVATVMYNSIKNLGITQSAHCGFVLINEEKQLQELWGSQTDSNFLTHFTLPLISDQVFLDRYEAWKRKEPFFSQKLDAQQLKKHMEVAMPDLEITEEERRSKLEMPETTYFHFGNFSNGYLQIIASEPFDKEQSSVLIRFARVFEQTYTRFLDLQKAEAQAREAQIEAALERIRARSMAMFKSEELANVVSLMYAQIQNLGFRDWGCEIVLCDEEAQVMRYWLAELNMSHSPEFFNVPLTNDTIRKIWKLWKQGIPQFTIELLNKEKDDFTEYMLTETGFKNLPDEVKEGWRSVENVFFCYTNIKYGLLEFIDIVPFAEENLLVYQRFAKVFEQTYTRFLDLQKAESQAREAQIEAGLERVRSRSMAMHKSEELSEVVTLVYEEIRPFGFATAGLELILMDEKNELQQYWLSTAPENKIIECFNIPTSIHPHFRKQWKAWEDQIPRLTLILEGQEKKAFDQLIFTQTDFKNLSDEVKEFIQNHGNVDVFSHAIMKYGLLEAVDKSPLSEEKFVLLERFAKVFEQTYTRFLDLQKAEAQAREAQIEAALERVRSSAMAMHTSKDLHKVAEVLRKQIGQLDYKDLETCAIHLYDESPDYFVSWAAQLSPGSESDIVHSHVHFPKTGVEIFDEMMEGYNTGKKDYVIVNEEKKMVEFLKTLKMCAPDGYQVVLNTFKDFKPEDYRSFWTISDFTGGSLVMTTLTKPDNATHDLLSRFANVFGLAYRRFTDLKQAEAQTREAQIEAALERVRSRTMAMRRSGELADVATILFQQVKALGVPQWVCGFCIFEIDDKEFTWYPGSPDGDILTPCKVPLMEHPVFIVMNESKKRGDELYVYELAGEIQADNYRYMLTIPGLRELLQDMLDAGLRLPEFQINHLANFSHGNLLFITYEHYPEMHDIFKRFTKVFEQTYTRFLDLQKAEAQTREAQIESALERVRAASMAMHKSEELAKVVTVLYHQVKALQIDFFQLFSSILYLEKGNQDVWMSPIEGILEEPFYYNAPTAPWENTTIKDWKEGKEFSYVSLQGTHAIQQFFHIMEEMTGTAYFNKVIKNHVYHFEKLESTEVNHKYGRFGFVQFVKATDEEKNILKRFAKVFEQAYTRFLDLQKAEAQAREAQIEAALERVRSRSLAMHTSEELVDVATVLYKELRNLDVREFLDASIVIFDERENRQTVWIARTEAGNLERSVFPLLGDQILQKIFNLWSLKESFFTVKVEGSALKDHCDFVYPISSRTELEASAIEGMPDPTYFHCAYYSMGYLELVADKELSEGSSIILTRFAKVFDQSYTRFLDLQKAEAQALRAEQDLVEIKAARKKAEETLEKLKSTQAQLIQSEKMASLGELTAGIAHEIQNPLNFVNNFSEINKELLDELKGQRLNGSEASGGERKEQAETVLLNDIIENEIKINQHGKRADAIVKGMLQHSRISTGVKEPTDINALCDEYLRLAYHAFQAGLRAKEIVIAIGIETVLGPNLPKIEVIPQDIGRVLLNLINNGFQAIEEQFKQGIEGYKPTLWVNTKSDNGQILISIKDNGPGIPDHIKDKIFQPFFTTKPTGQGTGLGLSLAYDIVKAHGGSISVISNYREPGTDYSSQSGPPADEHMVENFTAKGSEFLIKLPIAPWK